MMSHFTQGIQTASPPQSHRFVGLQQIKQLIIRHRINFYPVNSLKMHQGLPSINITAEYLQLLGMESKIFKNHPGFNKDGI